MIGIKVLQHNANRQAAAHHTLLQHAFESKAYVVLIQEPYCPGGRKDSYHTVSHLSFYTVLPMPILGSLRPHVMAYVRKKDGLEFTPRYDLASDPYWQVLEVFSGPESFFFVNVYNEKQRLSRQGTQT